MGRYSTISVNEVLTRAKLQLRIFDSSQDDYLQILIYEALRHVDALPMLIKKQEKLCVSEGRAKLPCDFNKLLAVITETQCEDGGKNVCTQQIYIDKPFLRECDIKCNSFDDYSGTMQINAGYLFLSNVDEVHIAYMGLNTDKDGNLVIYEDYERALMNYACAMFMMAFSENYNQYLIDRHNRTWIAQKNWLRGEAVRNDFDNTKFQIKKIFNAIVLNPMAVLLDAL